MDRVLRSRKKVVFAGAAISMALLAIMAALAHPPLWLAVALLVAFCFFCAYGTVIVAQGRGLFPDRLAGRGVTTVNMAQCLGLAVLPAGTGYVVEAFGAGDTAYGMALSDKTVLQPEASATMTPIEDPSDPTGAREV